MALPKTFSSGERLFASDLNSNFEDLDTRLGTIDLEDLANVSGTATDGQILEYDTGTSSWGPVDKPEGGLVAVKSVLKTDAFVSGTVSAGGNTPITGVSITHSVSDPANKIILMAHVGAASTSTHYIGGVGFVFYDGSNFIGRGDAASSNVRTVTGGFTSGSTSFQRVVNTLAASVVHTPGSGSFTYTLRAQNIVNANSTIYVNRTPAGTDANNPRSSTSMILMEVSV